jgi:hypothetical protein
MRGLPELQISRKRSVSATIAAMSSSGIGIGPPVMWPTMSGPRCLTMAAPATWLAPDRETPPE